MIRVKILPNPFEPENFKTIECESFLECVKSEFVTFPQNAKVFHKNLDITENLQNDENFAEGLSGDFTIIINPSFAWLLVALVAVTAAVTAFAFMSMPKVAVSASQSPNNDLQSRQNVARLGGRIPEIFGQVRSYPDLISPTITYYNDNGKEIKEDLMVIGRGYYQINDFREVETSVLDIPDYSVSIYDPNESIVGTNTIFKVGETFTEAPLSSVLVKSINGQSLNNPSEQKIESPVITFKYPNIINANTAGDFTQSFQVGDKLGIVGAEYAPAEMLISAPATLKTTKQVIIESAIDVPNANTFQKINLVNAGFNKTTTFTDSSLAESFQVTNYYDLSGIYNVSAILKTAISGGFRYEISLLNPQNINENWLRLDEDADDSSVSVTFMNSTNAINLNGTYVVESVTSSQITIVNPEIINEDWIKLATLINQETDPKTDNVRLDKISDAWVGWFNVDREDTEELIFNLYYPNGLFYQDSKGGVWEELMTVRIEHQALNDENVPIGPIHSMTQTIQAVSKSAFGRTIRINLSSASKVRFRIARTTDTKNDKTQDLTKIKEVYAVAKIPKYQYPDVTVVRIKAFGTEGALALKELKANCLVTRRLPLNGTGALTATKSAAQALIYCAINDRIGRKTIQAVDVAQILATESEIIDYFGSSKASEFSHTIDDKKLSFEEIAGMIASTIFCEPSRTGNKIQLSFEKPQDVSVLVFNQMNKVPNSETWTDWWDIDNNYDGVEVEYTSPDDDTRITYIASESSTPTNLMKVETSGIRTHGQAKTRAWREWNKLKLRKVTLTFEGFEEASLLNRNDRIIVGNGTSLRSESGDIKDVNVLNLTLSNEVRNIEAGSNCIIHLQIDDATVDAITCVLTDSETVALSRMPTKPLSLGMAQYTLIKATSTETQAFIVSESEATDGAMRKLTCYNYDSGFYAKDKLYWD